MKIVLIYRKQRPDAFSLEELFRAIGKELASYAEVVEYEVGERADIWRDVRALRQLQADIYHVTGDINYFVPLLPSGRTVLTVQDIGHYLYGLKGMKKLVYRLAWFSIPLRSAAAIVTGSLDTQGKLGRYFGLSPQRALLIDNCYSPLFRPQPRAFDKVRPRILQVGTKPYKNVPRLVRALDGIDCTLVLIGRLDDETRAALEQTQVRYENKTNLTQQQVVDEYTRADLVTFPSIGEGFGVPIIEAQAVGRPLVTSAVAPLCEVAGPGACLVDPLSEASIREGIQRLIADDAYREAVMAAGLVNARRYSVEATARRYHAVYESVLGRTNTPVRAATEGSQ